MHVEVLQKVVQHVGGISKCVFARKNLIVLVSNFGIQQLRAPQFRAMWIRASTLGLGRPAGDWFLISKLKVTIKIKKP